MHLRSLILAALLPLGWCEAAKVTINETAVNDGDGSPIGAVSASQFVEIGTLHTTVSAPTTWSSYRFTHWTFDGEPATVFRDPWRRSKNPISFQVAVAATATAHYLPATRDSDGDSLPDWYEIEHFGTLDPNGNSDSDGDGITLLAEYTAGSSPAYANQKQPGDVAWVDSSLVTCNLAGYPTYVLRSEPAGTVNQSTAVAPGAVVTAPDLAGNPSFGYWTLDGVRQQDPWGRALSTFMFTMGSQNREAVAYLFSGDSDGDSVPDAYEMRYYATLDHNGTSDTDGDGITLLAEYTAGSSPAYANSTQAGGVAWVDSSLVTCNLAGYPTYVLRSEPAGTVNQSATVAPGTVVTTPDLSGNSSFGYWTLDGVRQADPWGRALSILTFTMGSVNREAVAWMFSGDSDGDSVPDAYEMRYYATLEHNGSSDSDGDGINLLAEYTAGSSPLFSNNNQPGGVAWVDSSLLTLDLQAIILVKQPADSPVAHGGQRSFSPTVPQWQATLVFTIHNAGGRALTNIQASLTGPDAALFSISSPPQPSLQHNESCTFTVNIVPTSSGLKNATLRIASNAVTRNPYEIQLQGDVLSSGQDADGDGINDASEFRMAAMGFDWQVPQPGLVATYRANARLNGLYTPDQVRVVRVAKPQIAQAREQGRFVLRLRISESPSDLQLNGQGGIGWEFDASGDEEFYWVESE